MRIYQSVETPSQLNTCQGKEINPSDVNNLETWPASEFESVASVLNVQQHCKCIWYESLQKETPGQILNFPQLVF